MNDGKAQNLATCRYCKIYTLQLTMNNIILSKKMNGNISIDINYATNTNISVMQLLITDALFFP